MKSKYNSVAVAWVLFVISQLLALLTIYLLKNYHKYPVYTDQIKKELPLAIIPMFITTVVTNGQGMVIFRLLPGFKTNIIKYVHAIVHTVIIFTGYRAWKIIKKYDSLLEKPREDYYRMLIEVTWALYLLQWLVAVIIYLYRQSVQPWRKVFSAWHNFVGICVFQLCIVDTIVHMRKMDNYMPDYYDTTGASCVCLTVIYGLFIDAIVLNPYFEWPLVGPL